MQEATIIPSQPHTVTPIRELYSIDEAAQYLRCSKVTFWKIRSEANLQATFIGKRPYFHKNVLDNYLGLNNQTLAILSDILAMFNVDRITLLKLEVENKIKTYLHDGVLKYKISEVEAALNCNGKEAIL
jgi:excisionase family DNA binding protein